MAGVFALLCIFFMYVNIIFMSVVKKNASLRDEGGVGLGQGHDGYAHTVCRSLTVRLGDNLCCS